MEIVRNIIKLQVFKFLLVGLFCACIEFLTFNGLISAFSMKYLIANVISIVVAININYVLSKYFVFEKSRYSKQKEIFSFILFSVLAIILNQFILWFFVEFIRFDIRICKMLTIVIVAVFNFLTKKYIVFKA
jgi:putative flippase GtrA